ncbi:MAG: tRNA lysidine(34) synthetase TilS [Eubacteriales bacterium]|nr:tRNA lysidine(34) synthetase TilS [Eubacteriales bacterium]
MDRFSNRVLKTIREENLIPEGSFVRVGFSGGADSVCLLSVLFGLKSLLKINIEAVHVNHNLRGEEALRDEAFCRSFCGERGIPFRAVGVDVEGLVHEKGLSTEEAARILRYEVLLEESLPEADADGKFLLAVAHHADDQAETILLNLIRGTGLTGLKGMSFKRDNIIRPLLNESREEILKYLRKNDISFVTDSTNTENDYARNAIRNLVLPELKKLNSRAAEHIVGSGAIAGEADEVLRLSAADILEEVKGACNEKEIQIKRKLLQSYNGIERRYVIIEALKNLGVPLKDWGECHIGDIDKALFGCSGYHLDLPYGVKTQNTYDMIIIRKG